MHSKGQVACPVRELGSAVFAMQVISSFLVNFLPEKRPLIHWVCPAMLGCSLAIHTHTHTHTIELAAPKEPGRG